jgi:hypothetical protein
LERKGNKFFPTACLKTADYSADQEITDLLL